MNFGFNNLLPVSLFCILPRLIFLRTSQMPQAIERRLGRTLHNFKKLSELLQVNRFLGFNLDFKNKTQNLIETLLMIEF